MHVLLKKNMQEMQSSNCRRYGIMAQMWVVSAILLLTIAVFTINAEQHIEPSEHRAYFAGDGLQVSIYYLYHTIYVAQLSMLVFFLYIANIN